MGQYRYIYVAIVRRPRTSVGGPVAFFSRELLAFPRVAAQRAEMALLLLSDGASPVDSMIRLTSVWILVLFAASPVATPFSACDLRMFLAHSAAEQRLPALTTALGAVRARGGGFG